MSTPFIGQLMLFPFGFAPKGWAQCNGQLLSINSNQPLFSLLGTTYGGDGRINFGLPDLRGKTAISFGNNHVQGESGGEEAHTLSQQEVPPHNHQLVATTDSASSTNATGNLLGTSSLRAYLNSNQAPTAPLAPGTIQNAGNSQPHENRQPYLTLNWCIALQGIYPSRN